ncbi:MAG TPA: TlyA family rRNA (cytidine-2'-O)-methyltransferase [Peptococcaceae bacterium]|nr:TlyA family rRNA (cytidine-2'-O)-methyltransferase [Peptococcaceae bacterium]
MSNPKKKRIDQLLVERGYFASRERAKRSLMAGMVFYEGRRIDKPGTFVDPDGEIGVKEDPCPFVSRGGLKLDAALREFDTAVQGRVALDCGASTGGFTDCLLRRGAKMVYAVDVGYGQLAWELRQDPRVVVLERTNLRYLTPEQLGTRVDLVTLDLSFISLTKVFVPIRELLTGTGKIIALVKPQFEAGPQLVGKGGIVRDPDIHRQVLLKTIQKAIESGFQYKRVTYSSVCGANGNIEFFLSLGTKQTQDNNNYESDVCAVVEKAHCVLKERHCK